MLCPIKIITLVSIINFAEGFQFQVNDNNKNYEPTIQIMNLKKIHSRKQPTASFINQHTQNSNRKKLSKCTIVDIKDDVAYNECMEYLNSNSSRSGVTSNSHQVDFVIVNGEEINSTTTKQNCKVFNLKRNQYVPIRNSQELCLSSHDEGRMQQHQHHVEFIITEDKRKKNQSEPSVSTKTIKCKPIMSIKDENLKNCQLDEKKVPFVIQ